MTTRKNHCALEKKARKNGVVISRRSLLQTGALLGASAALMGKVDKAMLYWKR